MGPIVIVGALGQLGQALRRRLADRSPVALDLGELDVGDPAAVDRSIGKLRPSVVLNTSAFNHVDDAELRPDEAFRTNALGPWALARATDTCGALLVHFSTDYVFRGDARTPYGEDDVPAPQSVYGASKLAGERLVAGVNPLHMLIRTAGLYGPGGRGGKGRNFVNTMVHLGAEGRAIRVVDDQRVSPTSAADLARKVVELVDRWAETRAPELLGLYHVTNAGSCSWFELARETFRLCGARGTVEPVTTAQYGARARRPAYSVLARRHLERLGLDDLRSWQEALADYLAERVNPRSGT
jgi:dTDP-4-dehydrorhamnose reductase